jgi:nucleoid DNA-binding protein
MLFVNRYWKIKKVVACKYLSVLKALDFFTIKKSAETIETFFKLVKRFLKSGEDVLVSGFGRFCVKKKHRQWKRDSATGGVGQGATKKSHEVSQMTRSDISILDMINGKACFRNKMTGFSVRLPPTMRTI